MAEPEVFFGDDTPWYCAACGEEMYRGGMIVVMPVGHSLPLARLLADGLIAAKETQHSVVRRLSGESSWGEWGEENARVRSAGSTAFVDVEAGETP